MAPKTRLGNLRYYLIWVRELLSWVIGREVRWPGPTGFGVGRGVLSSVGRKKERKGEGFSLARIGADGVSGIGILRFRLESVGVDETVVVA